MLKTYEDGRLGRLYEAFVDLFAQFCKGYLLGDDGSQRVDLLIKHFDARLADSHLPESLLLSATRKQGKRESIGSALHDFLNSN